MTAANLCLEAVCSAKLAVTYIIHEKNHKIWFSIANVYYCLYNRNMQDKRKREEVHIPWQNQTEQGGPVSKQSHMIREQVISKGTF